MTRPRSDRIVPTPIGPKLRQGPSSTVWNRTLVATFAAAGLLIGAGQASADIDPSSGIDFVTFGAPGNAPWVGVGFNNGLGAVGYEYRMGRLEVTTAQWAEFMNAALDRPSTDRIPHVFAPTQWGAAATTPHNPGARRYAVPAGRELFPAGGIDWRTGAIYCNWLHNGKSLDRAAFLSGAYDVGTFGYIGDGGGFTDQLTRSPGARYWIPSLSEWMKAAHYDPAKVNSDGSVGGWWTYSNSSDAPFVYGPPGVRSRTSGLPGPDPSGPFATANAGWDDLDFPGFNPFAIPLGSYPTVQSPWGLLDVAGGTREWAEGVFQLEGEPVPRDRWLEGTGWFFGTNGSPDTVGVRGASGFPTDFSFQFGFRIASIPAPGPCSLVVGAVLLLRARRPRRSS